MPSGSIAGLQPFSKGCGRQCSRETRKILNDVRAIYQERNMPDVRSPRMTMAERNSTAKRLPGGEDRGSPHRSWKCPPDEMIASYLDAAVDSPSRSPLESHLADCEYCRALVAELAKVQRDREMPSLPPGLMQRAVALVPPKSTRMHWLWVPAAAMAGTAVLVVTSVVR